MPVAAFRTTWGVSLDKNHTTLSAAAAAAATTLNVNTITGTIGNLYTVTIVDGPLTEQVACSASTSNTLTVAATANAHPAGTYVTAQLTASLGPADYLPVTVLDVEDQIVQLPDKGFRGSAVEQYDSKQGTRVASVSVGGDVFADTIGYLLGSVTGSVDYTGGPPNQHAFATNNAGDTQPTPEVWWVYNNIDTRVFAGAKASEVGLKFDPSGLLTWTGKIMGFMSGPVAATTASYTSEPVSESWRCAVQLGGSTVTYVENVDLTLKRGVDAVYSLVGTQDPYRIWSAATAIDGKMTVVFEDNTQLNNFLNNSQPAFDIKWTAGGLTPHSVEVHSTKANYTTAKPKMSSKGYWELDIDWVGLANTTDKTTAGGGYAPYKATIINGKTTGTFQ